MEFIGSKIGTMQSLDNAVGNQSTTVLFIDDNEEIRTLFHMLFHRHFDVICVESVDRGLEVLKQHKPRLMFIDYDMPGKNGIQGIREARAMEPQINIIMLSGSATQDLVQYALKEGACECLEKPFDYRKIHERIQHYLPSTQPPANPDDGSA